MVLRNGGTLYIDGGKPAPGLFATSLANLRSVMPTVYFNVPRGFDMLIAALRDDDESAPAIFHEVKFAFYAGAALPQNLWEALEEMSIKTIGRAMPMVSAWGSTETSPLATDCHFQAHAFRQYRRADSRHRAETGAVGRQAGGARARSQRHAGLLEIAGADCEGIRRRRLLSDRRCRDVRRSRRGRNWDCSSTAASPRISNSLPAPGSASARCGSNGIAALAPLAQDIVVTGHGGDQVRFLVFPNLAACRALAGLPESAPSTEVLRSEKVRAAIAQGLARN